jgi:hypothetical protein
MIADQIGYFTPTVYIDGQPLDVVYDNGLLTIPLDDYELEFLENNMDLYEFDHHYHFIDDFEKIEIN